VNAESFDLIVSDFHMPKMNGEEFCRQLRQDSRFKSLPIIMLSAKGLELDSKTLK
jgi:CheY-like chemotaxis protein